MSSGRLQLARNAILAAIRRQPVGIFRRSDLGEIIDQHRGEWKTQAGAHGFAEFLADQRLLRKIIFDFPKPYKKETRYTLPETSFYEVCLSIRPTGYFSHYTAIRLNNLTEQLPKTIYLNVEQANKSTSTGTLTQASIDSAFRRAPRTTKQVAEIGDTRLMILQGKNTNQHGVISKSVNLDRDHPNVTLRFTNLERTLIDAVVRPQYAGGIAEVQKAFQLARPNLAVQSLIKMLKELDYIYPYHQAIGFYLQRAGFSEPELATVRELPVQFDFQIAHGLKETDYIKEWRLRVPKGF